MYCQTKSKQIEFENYFVQKKLKGFNPKTCQAWRKLTERFGPKISHEEILSLVCYQSNKLVREEAISQTLHLSTCQLMLA